MGAYLSGRLLYYTDGLQLVLSKSDRFGDTKYNIKRSISFGRIPPTQFYNKWNLFKSIYGHILPK